MVRVVFRAGDGRPGWLASVEVTNGPCSPLSVPGWSLLLMERCPGGTRRDSACDMMHTVILTLSIKDVDRACVTKPKESKYMGL